MNPFADKKHPIDYGLLGENVNLDVKRNSGAKIPISTSFMDLAPASFGVFRSQEDWISLYNKQEGEFKGKKMISAPDIYRAGKEGSKELLESLRKDLNEDRIITATKILYDPADMSARIFHNFNCTHAGLSHISTKVAEVPFLGKMLQGKALSDLGILYAQALFDTNDDEHMIMATLENLIQKGAEEIYFWTPDQELRKKKSELAVGFNYGNFDGFGDIKFLIGGDWGDDYSGLSRGVKVRK